MLAYVLPDADPVHKVTILPTGMALGVTQQLPMEERHIYRRDYIEDTLAVRMGGRVRRAARASATCRPAPTTTSSGNTELARKMVREWGMSDRIGPMAWGSQGTVFLGEDLMHTRDYSDETSRVIDEEVERILREQEERATEHAHRAPQRASTRWPPRCSRRRRSTAPRSAAWSTRRSAAPVHRTTDTVPTFGPDARARGRPDHERPRPRRRDGECRTRRTPRGS